MLVSFSCVSALSPLRCFPCVVVSLRVLLGRCFRLPVVVSLSLLSSLLGCGLERAVLCSASCPLCSASSFLPLRFDRPRAAPSLLLVWDGHPHTGGVGHRRYPLSAKRTKDPACLVSRLWHQRERGARGDLLQLGGAEGGLGLFFWPSRVVRRGGRYCLKKKVLKIGRPKSRPPTHPTLVVVTVYLS